MNLSLRAAVAVAAPPAYSARPPVTSTGRSAPARAGRSVPQTDSDGSLSPLTVARVDALFASDLSAWSQPTHLQVATAISSALRRHGGSRGCAGEVAAVYGDHPEIAVVRMRWARWVIYATYPANRGA